MYLSLGIFDDSDSLRCRITSKIFQCPKIALTTRTTGRLFWRSLDEMSWDFGKNMGLVPGRWSPRCAPKFSFHLPTGWKAEDGWSHPFPMFFHLMLKPFGFAPFTVYPWCKCSKKVQERRVFRNLLTKLIDDLLNIPLFIFPQQHPSFFCFWGGIICSSTSSTSRNIERWKKTLNSTKADVLMLTTGNVTLGVRWLASTFFMIIWYLVDSQALTSLLFWWSIYMGTHIYIYIFF